jgi:hypothetical protein
LVHLRGAVAPALWQLEIRMFDHIGLVVSDLARGKRFYAGVLDPDGNNLEAGIYLGS